MIKIKIEVIGRHEQGHMVVKSTRIIDLPSCADYPLGLQADIADMLERYFRECTDGLEARLALDKKSA